MRSIRGHIAELDEGAPSRIGAFRCFRVDTGAQGNVFVKRFLVHATLVDGALGMTYCFVGEKTRPGDEPVGLANHGQAVIGIGVVQNPASDFAQGESKLD